MPTGSFDFNSSAIERRSVIAGAAAVAALAGIGSAKGEEAQPAGGPLSPDIPLVLPKAEFVYEALVAIDQGVIKLGKGPLGERRMVPITGGSFEGPRIKGTVVSGGADRQLVRADGATMLNALYELKTDDGAIITVNNRVLIDKRTDGSRYAFSQIEITAPEGPHDWLNHRVLVGDLHSDPAKPHEVLIRVYSLS